MWIDPCLIFKLKSLSEIINEAKPLSEIVTKYKKREVVQNKLSLLMKIFL
jgi:hypothetical protein